MSAVVAEKSEAGQHAATREALHASKYASKLSAQAHANVGTHRSAAEAHGEASKAHKAAAAKHGDTTRGKAHEVQAAHHEAASREHFAAAGRGSKQFSPKYNR